MEQLTIASLHANKQYYQAIRKELLEQLADVEATILDVALTLAIRKEKQ
jgi:hypothetical protein